MTATQESDLPYFKGCCRHAASEHDQHGCTVDVSADSRCYWRCHDLGDKAVDPRWRDFHTLPDEWLYRLLTKRRKGGWRAWIKRVPWLWKVTSRYALNHFYCTRHGECVLRNNHRGSCTYGADDDD